MQIKTMKSCAIALIAPALTFAIPVSAAPMPAHPVSQQSMHSHASADILVQHDRGRHRGERRGRGYEGRYDDHNRYGSRNRDYGQPIYRDTRIWRGRDGQYYCRKENGTTGLLIGAAVGGLIGNEVAGRGDRTLGAILGAAGGAILGRSIDRSNSRCR